MANINVTWTNPADLSDINQVKVYRKDGDHSALDLTDTTDGETFRTGATLLETVLTANLTAGGTNSYTDSGVTSGSYTYAAFSENDGGFGPGDQNDSPVVVS